MLVTWHRRRETLIIFDAENDAQGGISCFISLIPDEEEKYINSTYAIVPGWKSGWHSLCDRWGTKVQKKV